MTPPAVIACADAISSPPRAAEPDAFRENQLLAGIESDAYAQITREIELVPCTASDIIFEEDDPGDALYLIAHGSIKISKKGRAGQQETLACLSEGDFFGEMTLVDQGRRSAQASAVGQALLGKISRPTWDRLLHLAPQEVLKNFTRVVTQRLRQNNQRFIEEMMRNERLSLLGTTVSSIVHDLNNPIAAILGACEIIRCTQPDERTVKMTGMIRDAVDRMQNMTRELLDFSRGQAKLHLQTITVSDLLRDLETDFAACRPLIEVQVEASCEESLEVDRHRFLRVFGNLIRNAREAMKGQFGGVLRLDVERLETQVRFILSDTGCGIPAELLPQIFEPFVTHGKANGTGLGLAVSKAAIEAHRGTITVQSSGRGTTFRIDLPRRA